MASHWHWYGCCWGLMLMTMAMVARGHFGRDFEITWGADGSHAQVIDNGRHMHLSLDKSSGGAFQSKKEFLFGRFDVRMKLVGGNSAGTVTTFYLSSTGDKHDEIDMEFLGNETGKPYVLHTNIYAQGKGDREEQFNLWFDPTKAFHSYSVLWTPSHVIFLVDDAPIRLYAKTSAVPFPSSQPMKVYGSLWNADDWATQGGRVKTDWSLAPFEASYRMFRRHPCLTTSAGKACMVSTPDKWWNQLGNGSSSSSSSSNLAGNAGVNGAMEKLRWVQRNYRIYSYCLDSSRFRGAPPLDCPRSS
eukprot:TRINITY_DN2227_c0_g1_i5.p1 TRINITY_DN2227_c0_g1~~TRINITY_DN2227_c0_g1_i5.p1  ORF type:complete len:325 (+),score=6.32 TRINITY_DN2227_c0_g1_i5:72-977(+)